MTDRRHVVLGKLGKLGGPGGLGVWGTLTMRPSFPLNELDQPVLVYT